MDSVVDLRKSVGDGVTLVKLAEKTCELVFKSVVFAYVVGV